jgi:ribosomal protein S18 acetylase RimI-like enzyme
MKLVKATQLDQVALSEVHHLVDLVAKHDGFAPKFYWYSTENRRNEEFSDFLFYTQSQCVAYLAIYQFTDDEVEVCAVVHPKFRRKGLFTRLWLDASLELYQRGVSKAIFNQHAHDHDNAPKSLKGIGARYFRSEYLYCCDKMDGVTGSPEITLRLAHQDDVDLISRMDLACFGGDQSELRERIHELLEESDRSIYLAQDSEHNIVGKVHALCQERVILHDFCVLPDYQSQGYGKAILQQVTTLLLAEGNHSVCIETTSDDYQINKLYQSSGFVLADQYRQWIFQLAEVYQHHSTVH